MTTGWGCGLGFTLALWLHVQQKLLRRHMRQLCRCINEPYIFSYICAFVLVFGAFTWLLPVLFSSCNLLFAIASWRIWAKNIHWRSVNPYIRMMMVHCAGVGFRAFRHPWPERLTISTLVPSSTSRTTLRTSGSTPRVTLFSFLGGVGNAQILIRLRKFVDKSS